MLIIAACRLLLIRDADIIIISLRRHAAIMPLCHYFLFHAIMLFAATPLFLDIIISMLSFFSIIIFIIFERCLRVIHFATYLIFAIIMLIIDDYYFTPCHYAMLTLMPHYFFLSLLRISCCRRFRC